MLVPALAFCQEETTATAITSPQGIELDVPGTLESETSLYHQPYSDSNPDDFLQKPAPSFQVSVTEGTVEQTDDTDTYMDDLYGQQYDDIEISASDDSE